MSRTVASVKGKKSYILTACYHEAGHALSALRESRFVPRVVVSTPNPGSGICFHASHSRLYFDLAKNSGTAKAAWLAVQNTTKSDIRILLAGPLAEAKALGKPLRSLGSVSDLEKCLYVSKRLSWLGGYAAQYTDIEMVEPNQLLETEKRGVRSWLSNAHTWKKVMWITRGLYQKGDLNSNDLNYLIGRAASDSGQKSVMLDICLEKFEEMNGEKRYETARKIQSTFRARIFQLVI